MSSLIRAHKETERFQIPLGQLETTAGSRSSCRSASLLQSGPGDPLEQSSRHRDLRSESASSAQWTLDGSKVSDGTMGLHT